MADTTGGIRISIHESGAVLSHRACSFDMISEDKKLRIVLSNAKISAVKEGGLCRPTLLPPGLGVSAC
ncbi:hypothetical protein [Nocardia coubleae]|uniref:Uncharacterized protein n=1 Tax=Nocardia coubleae TaxID=356147 RepID=A0A846W0B0_9NOCA|nr:hypothetical protein [Nocardia coubleae]NKX86539.1 hypothetical protein [Nocardia coubleae]